jgi:hypothetical protein
MNPPIPTYKSDTVYDVPFLIGNRVCNVRAVITETMNLQTGDVVDTVSVREILDVRDDQLVSPATLSLEEFRRLVNKIRLITKVYQDPT